MFHGKSQIDRPHVGVNLLLCQCVQVNYMHRSILTIRDYL